MAARGARGVVAVMPPKTRQTPGRHAGIVAWFKRPPAVPRRMAEALARIKKVPGAVWGLLALALGMTLGTLFPAQLGFIGDWVGLGFKGLAKAAPFIIFFTIAAAILDMLRTGKAGRFAFWVSIVFTGLGLLAGFLAILMTVPLFNLSWTGGESDIGAILHTIGLKTILLTHSSPSFIAVFYAAFCAILLNYGAKWKATAWVARPTLDVIRMVGVEGIALVGRGLKVAFPYLLFGIGIFIPSAIGDAVLKTEEGLGSSSTVQTVVGSNPVALYFLTVWIQVVVLAVFIFSLILLTCWLCKFSLRQFMKEYFAYVYPFAWATSSSAASIPVNLERTGSGLKVRKEIREFIIPLGATVNLDGAIMACFVISTMAAILVGYQPTFIDLLILLIPIKIVTLGVPGIPGGIAAVVPPVVAEILPLPPGSDAAFIAIWFGFSVGLSDQFRTGVNTTTNGIVSMWFEKVYDRHFARKDEGGAPAGDPAYDVVEKPA